MDFSQSVSLLDGFTVRVAEKSREFISNKIKNKNLHFSSSERGHIDSKMFAEDQVFTGEPKKSENFCNNSENSEKDWKERRRMSANIYEKTIYEHDGIENPPILETVPEKTAKSPVPETETQLSSKAKARTNLPKYSNSFNTYSKPPKFQPLPVPHNPNDSSLNSSSDTSELANIFEKSSKTRLDNQRGLGLNDSDLEMPTFLVNK